MATHIPNVLVIDDNRTDRELIAALLGAKYRVLEAADAVCGLELYRSEHPDCVLLDHQMPGTAGLDALTSAHEVNTPAQYVSDNLRFLADGFADLLPLLRLCKELLDEDPAAPSDSLARLRVLAANADLAYFVEEARPAIEQASEGMTQIKKIVSAMKELSHPRDDMQPTDLNHVITNMVTVTRCEWKHVADIALDLADDLPLISCFPSEINQVVLNLLVNAAQAIDERRGEAEGGHGMGRIGIVTRRDGDDVVLTISDSGAGIPEEIRGRIFEPFFTTKAIGKGTGQGLAITHRIVVDHHCGSIDVTSEVERGTCFAIRLPIQAMAPDPEGRGDYCEPVRA